MAIWRTAKGQRFQNYKATFSVLDTRHVGRAWLTNLLEGTTFSHHAPAAWTRWQRTGIAERLLVPRSVTHRTREEQLPRSGVDQQILQAVYEHFRDRPHAFEQCAAQLWMMLAPGTEELVLTRPSRDGGRDAIGQCRLGPPADPIRIDFALEAKCYQLMRSVVVKEVSRLISRLRHRNFGVLVTTSWIGTQAYQEIRDDRHPVALVCGSDIVDVLRSQGYGSVEAVRDWLRVEFTGRSSVDVIAASGIVAIDVNYRVKAGLPLNGTD